MKIDAIILAGGMGTRLRKIVPDVPKSLASVNNKPFLDYLLKQLDSCACVDKLIIAAGYKSRFIIDRYANDPGYNYEILFSVEKKLLGTGGAIKRAVSLTDSPDVLVMNGDSYTGLDLGDLIAVHRKKRAFITIALKKVPDAGRFGSVQIDKKGRVLSFKEKTGDKNPALVNAGIYIINRDAFDGVKKGKVLSFERDILPGLAGQRMYGYISKGRFIDIGMPETYKLANEYFKRVQAK